MPKVFLISFFGSEVQGARVLTSFLDKHGVDVRLCILKEFRVQPLEQPNPQTSLIECLVTGELMSSQHETTLWTEAEQALLEQELTRYAPDLIGVSAPSWFDEFVPAFVQRLKGAAPGVPVVAGGLGPTFTPEAYLPHCTAIVRGAGEEALLRLTEMLPQNDPAWHDIPNVGYVDKHGQTLNPVTFSSSTLSNAPAPYYGPRCVLIDEECIAPEPIFRNKTYHTFVGRGCLGNCSFCATGKSGNIVNGQRRVIRCIEHVFDELLRAKELGFSRVHFFDEHFTFPRETFDKFLTFYKKNICLPFIVQLHPVQIVNNPDLLDALVDAGMDYTVVALQSASRYVSEDIFTRPLHLDTTLAYAEMLGQRGVRRIYQFISANPYETEEHSAENLAFIRKLPFRHGHDSVEVYRLAIFPGAELKTRLDKDNLLLPDGQAYLYRGHLHFLEFLLPEDEMARVCANRAYREDPQKLGRLVRETLKNAEDQCESAMKAACYGHTVEAEAHLQHAARYLENSTYYNAAKAAVLLAQNKADAARPFLDDCVAYLHLQGDNPNHPISRFGELSGLKQRWTDALLESLSRCKAHINHTDIAVMIADMLISEARYPEAEYLLNEYRCVAPNCSHFRLLLAQIFAAQSRDAEIPALFVSQPVMDSQAYVLAVETVRTLTSMGQLEQARKVWNDILAHGYLAKPTLHVLFNSFQRSPCPQSAEHWLGEWARVPLTCAQDYFVQAEILRAIGHFIDAATKFQEGLTFEPQNVDARRALGGTLARLERYEEALEQFRLVLDVRPDFYALHINIASALRQLNRFDEALDVLEKLEKLAPETPYIRESRERIRALQAEQQSSSL